MAPSLFRSISILVLGLKTVSATYTCTPAASTPAGTTCGIHGSINNFDYFEVDLFDSQYLTPEGCAAACADSGNCRSFYLDSDEDGFCELHGAIESDVGFVTDPTSYYVGYDLSCFVCNLPSIPPPIPSNVSIPTNTSTAAPTTTAPLVCNQDNCFRAFLRFPDDGAEFCETYTTAINTQSSSFPGFLDNCNNSPFSVSSGCSCLFSPTAAPSTSSSTSSPTSVPATTTPSVGPLSTGFPSVSGFPSSSGNSSAPYPASNSTTFAGPTGTAPYTPPTVGPLSTGSSSSSTSSNSSVPYPLSNSTTFAGPTGTSPPTVGPLTTGFLSSTSSNSSVPYPLSNSTTFAGPTGTGQSTVGPLTTESTSSSTSSNSSVPYPMSNSTTSATPTGTSPATVGHLTTGLSSSTSGGSSSSRTSSPPFPFGNSTTSSAPGTGGLPASSSSATSSGETVTPTYPGGSGHHHHHHPPHSDPSYPTYPAEPTYPYGGGGGGHHHHHPSHSKPAYPVYPTYPVESTTSTVYATTTYTITSCAPTVTDCPIGSVTTETIPLYTTVCPIGEEPPAPTYPVAYTTSTIYETKVGTITACSAWVKDCPVGSAVTRTIAVSTTVCPVEEAETTSAGEYTWSTVYATSTYNIGGSVTTETISLYTTYCPVEPASPTGYGYATAGVTTAENVPVAVSTYSAASFAGTGNVTWKATSASTSSGREASSTLLPVSNSASSIGAHWAGMGALAMLAGMLLL